MQLFLEAGYRNKSSAGFTLVEALVIVLIIAVLLALLFPAIAGIQLKAEGVVCSSRLRNLWTAFSLHLHDEAGWPQLPDNIAIGSLVEQRWWLETTSNSIGLTKKDWTCPTVSRMAGKMTNGQQVYLISYLPTLFDARPTTPLKWLRMPWFTEAVGSHGNGNLSVRADGSVCPIQDP